MTNEKYNELETRASRSSERDLIKKLEARQVIYGEIEKMREEGLALTLTDEEIRMLEAFRRFKLRMRKASEVFTWQTHVPEGIQVVQDTAEIVSPQDSD